MTSIDIETLKLNILEFLDRSVYLNRKTASIANIVLQVESLYKVSPKKPTLQDVRMALQELEEKGYLDRFKVGTTDAWGITSEGKKWLKTLRDGE